VRVERRRRDRAQCRERDHPRAQGRAVMVLERFRARVSARFSGIRRDSLATRPDPGMATRSIPDPRRPGAFGAAHRDPGDAYAGVPILQRPAWRNEVAAYFYLGGISSGALILGALADLSGPRWRSLA